ncbi:MAG: SPFH domain-containing protein [Bacteroidales bacterium]|nr:SPFH domain-containing protein [Bacteroidales bacterium]
MEQNQNFEYKGFKANGFVMFFVSLLVIAAGVWGIVNAVRTGYGLTAILGIVAIIVGLVMFGGLMVIEPNQARVLVFFGKYRGNFLKEGFWWVNPFISVKKISLRARNLNAEPIKVNDKMGNPIMIGLVLVWKVKAEEIYKAVFNIDAPKPATTTQVNNGQTAITTKSASESRMEALANFVAVQSDAALRQVAGCYAYDNNSAVEGELSLRSNADEINDQLEQKLAERLDMAGIEVIEARINYLAYAPEIAAVMLRRQQADAIISAREKIVEGAVSMVKMAIDQLADNNVVELDEERKAAMVSNLLVVLCSDESAQPVVNAGTLHH